MALAFSNEIVPGEGWLIIKPTIYSQTVKIAFPRWYWQYNKWFCFSLFFFFKDFRTIRTRVLDTLWEFCNNKNKNMFFCIDLGKLTCCWEHWRRLLNLKLRTGWKSLRKKCVWHVVRKFTILLRNVWPLRGSL